MTENLFPKPTIGRIVHYKLNDGDVGAIEHQRGLSGPAGNRVSVGDIYPAIVVRVFDPSVTTANLQVFLDGNDTYWATSRQSGDGGGTWSWPSRS